MANYKGNLTRDEIAEGIKACLDNGDRLRRSALALRGAGDFATATFVAIIRLEEIAKAALLQQLNDGLLTIDSFWKAFRNHAEKWATWKVIVMDQVKGMTEDERVRILREGAKSDAAFKNIALYVDFQGEPRRWTKPWELPFAEPYDQVRHALLLGDHLLIKVAPERVPPSWDADDEGEAG